MRINSIACFTLLLSLFMWSCKTYKPIEKATHPSNPALSKVENIAQQLATLEEGDLISITLDNEASHDLIYLAVDRDSLSAKLQKPKISPPMKIALYRIQGVKTEQVDAGMTLVFSAIVTGLAITMVYYSLNSLTIF